MPTKPRSITRPWLPTRKSSPASRIALRERDPFYHTTRWKKESHRHRTENPLCVDCLIEGIVNPGNVTDHEIPKDICPDPWDRSNWRTRCYKHHAIKSAKDKQHFKK